MNILFSLVGVTFYRQNTTTLNFLVFIQIYFLIRVLKIRTWNSDGVVTSTFMIGSSRIHCVFSKAAIVFFLLFLVVVVFP